jgi:DNA replication protein DnaC
MKITHPQLNQARASLFNFCAAYSKQPSCGRTVILYGENGSGKTRLIKQVCRWASLTAQFMPMVNRPDLGDQTGLAYSLFYHWPSVVDEFQKRQDIGAVDELMDCSLAVVDDIGAEHDPSGFGREQLYLLLSRREYKWNLFTTNFAPAEWDNKFERRIASRLFRNAEHIDLSMVPDFSTVNLKPLIQSPELAKKFREAAKV